MAEAKDPSDVPFSPNQQNDEEEIIPDCNEGNKSSKKKKKKKKKKNKHPESLTEELLVKASQIIPDCDEGNKSSKKKKKKKKKIKHPESLTEESLVKASQESPPDDILPPPPEDKPSENGLNNNATGDEPINMISQSGPDVSSTKSQDRHSRSEPESNAGRSDPLKRSTECSPVKLLPNTPEVLSPGIQLAIENQEGECTRLPVQEEAEDQKSKKKKKKSKKKKKKKMSTYAESLQNEAEEMKTNDLICSMPKGESLGNSKGIGSTSNNQGGRSSDNIQGCGSTDSTSGGSSAIFPGKRSSDNTSGVGLLDETLKSQSTGNVPGRGSTGNIPGDGSSNTTQGNRSTDDTLGCSSDIAPRKVSCDNISGDGLLDKTSEGQSTGNVLGHESTHITPGGSSGGTPKSGSYSNTPGGRSVNSTPKGRATGNTLSVQSTASKHVPLQHENEGKYCVNNAGNDVQEHVTTPHNKKNGNGPEDLSKPFVFVLHAFLDVTHWMKSPTQFKEVEVRSSLNGWQGNVASPVSYRKLEGNIIAIELTIQVPERKLSVRTPVFYKYYVTQHDQAPNHSCYEFLEHYEDGIINRILSQKAQYFVDKEGAHHRYDDFILPNPKSGFFEYFKALFKSQSQQVHNLKKEYLKKTLDYYMMELNPFQTDKIWDLLASMGQVSIMYRHLAYQHLQTQRDIFIIPNHESSLKKKLLDWFFATKRTVTVTPKKFQEVIWKQVQAVAILHTICGLSSNQISGIADDHIRIISQELHFNFDTQWLPPVQKYEYPQELTRSLSVLECLKTFVLLLFRRRLYSQCKCLDVLVLFLHFYDDYVQGQKADILQVFKSEEIQVLRSACETQLKKNASFWPERMISHIELLQHVRVGTLVLFILPIECWSSLVHHCALISLIDILDARFASFRFKDESSQKIHFLGPFFEQACTMLRQEQSYSVTQVPDVRKCFTLADKIITLQSDWSLRHKTAVFCLIVTGLALNYSQISDEQANHIIEHLAIKVCTAITRAIKVNCSAGCSYYDEFGVGKREGYPMELAMWTPVFRYDCSEKVKLKWHSHCAKAVHDRLSKVKQFKSLLQIMKVAEEVSASPDVLKRIILDNIEKCIHIIPEEDHKTFLELGCALKSFKGLLQVLIEAKYSKFKSITPGDMCSDVLWIYGMKLFKFGDPTNRDILNLAFALFQSTVEGISQESLIVDDVKDLTASHQVKSGFRELLCVFCRTNVDSDCEQSQHVNMIICRLDKMCADVRKFEDNQHLLFSILSNCEQFLGREAQDERDALRKAFTTGIGSLPVHKLPSHMPGYYPHVNILLEKCTHFRVIFEKPCGVVNKLWSMACTPVIQNFKDFAENIWPKFLETLSRVFGDLVSLKLTCTEAAYLLQPDKVKQELNALVYILGKCDALPETVVTNDIKWMKDVESKIQLFSRLQSNYLKATCLLDIKETLGLEGSFQAALDIKMNRDVYNERPLSCLDDRIENIVEFLEFPDEHIKSLLDCLDHLSKNCDLLITWLKEEMKDIGDLQRFTGIALIAHCEQGPSVDKLTTLEKVCTKLAPFIYQLPTDTDVYSFISVCKQIRLDNMHEMIEQLNFCSMELPWYKNVQSMLTSTEENTFGQVKDLTKHGAFVIAVDTDKLVPKTIKELISVTIQSEGHPENASSYDLDDLQDLQSKLALIRGNITEPDIQEMSDSFQNGMKLTCCIAGTLVKLIQTGHPKYQKYCCKYTLTAQCLKELGLIADESLQSLKDWRQRIKIVRTDCYEMNYYTCQQLSLICRELSDGSQPNRVLRFSAKFMNLIRSVFPPVTEKMAIAARNKVLANKRSISPEDSENAESTKVRSLAKKVKTLAELNKTELEIFTQLQSEEYPDDLILLGITQFGGDFVQVEDFCIDEGDTEVALQNRDKMSENQKMVLELQKSGFPLELCTEAVDRFQDYNKAYDFCLNIDSQASSTKNEEIEEKYLAVSVSTPKVDLWDLTDIGEYLKGIADSTKDDYDRLFSKERDFPTKFFQLGVPNVWSVPRSSLFQAVMTIYMYSDHLPLPTAGEVLCCHEGTTSEEIHLLWRRALGDPMHKRIFILVCEYNLPYNVAKEAVKDLRERMQGCSDNYKVIILCCQEDEYNSLLMSDLREFKRNNPLLQTNERAQRYLTNHFVARAQETFPLQQCGPLVQRSHVRLVSSCRSGMGKSLYIQQLAENCHAADERWKRQIVALHGPDVTHDQVVKLLLKAESQDQMHTLFHLDISQNIIDEIGILLFEILVLHSLHDAGGNVWTGRLQNLYVMEMTMPPVSDETKLSCSRTFLSMLPMVECLSPRECHNKGPSLSDIQDLNCYNLTDDQLFNSSTYQMVYQYLHCFSERTNTQSSEEIIKSKEILQLLLNIYKFSDPSWAELHHFVAFLSTQLYACQHSIYCDPLLVDDPQTGLRGFRDFVCKFMLNMSVDFTVPSLQSESEYCHMDEVEVQPSSDQTLQSYQIIPRRNWESNPHPYIFFNRDNISAGGTEYNSMTFLGFNLQAVGNMVNLLSLEGELIEDSIMNKQLMQWLSQSGVKVKQHISEWTKERILQTLSVVLQGDEFKGCYEEIDPDDSYALTYDNLIKMLAIQMRFRCGIPVVIMGETGCGKTRLIRYMCQLQTVLKTTMRGLEENEREPEEPRQTFFVLKVHGGIAEEDIVNFLTAVQNHAKRNKQLDLDTVVFFDEANTTDAVGLIKEIMCDRRIQGRAITEDVKFIAACNPYRKHTKTMIDNLESAGLGFFTKMTETKQKLGSTPLRHLVYRVLDIPASMKPLVYDYGGLNTDTERAYIERIVQNHVRKNDILAAKWNVCNAISKVLSWSQDYMRNRKDECSYVSLRDIERSMIVFEWFYKVYDDLSTEIQRIGDHFVATLPDALSLAMLLSVAVCYNSRLIHREDFESRIMGQFETPFTIPSDCQSFREIVEICQEAFLSNMELGPNIAHNAALRENVFMMAVCVELRIPLFVVGKPGSSKSLAKSTIAESMKGTNSKQDFLQYFQTVKTFSYQCSQLSTPDSIIDVFRKARDVQQRLRESSATVSLVVLDEVGLAEDSPSLPLKVLHPLLEDGTDGSDPHELEIDKEDRVAFIGISNWALDPAKMNRGIMVRRGEPDVQELVDSAKGICSNADEDPIRQCLEPILVLLAEAYLRILQKQIGERKEFFGLRDFYSLIKMLYWLIKGNAGLHLFESQLKHAILRNFGGGSLHDIDPVHEFEECFRHSCVIEEENEDDEMDCTPLGLIKSSLGSTSTTWHGESRYLLFLTENDAALDVVNSYLFKASSHPPYLLFGSSFPRDKDYTQVCRNINQIKICMETGRTVVLLNLENLYESLYDLLNQYYTRTIGNRYVDLGLQTHRIKCRVHNDFKLILVAEKDKVYEKFPIPLINRLEKHVVTTSTMLEPCQEGTLRDFQIWIKRFTSVEKGKHFGPKDAFVGFQEETPAAIVLHACQVLGEYSHSEVLNFCKELIIQTTCPDALARLKCTGLRDEAEQIWQIYFDKQRHLSLSQLIIDSEETLKCDKKGSMGLLIQVTTHSPPLAPVHVSKLRTELKISKKKDLLHMYLEEIDSEVNFTDRIEKHITEVKEGNVYILIQCSSGHLNKDLIACARHKVVDLLENLKKSTLWEEEYESRQRLIHIVFTVSLPKTPGGSKFISFQGGKWLCVHLDDLRSSDDESALSFLVAINAPLSDLFYPGCQGVSLYKRLIPCIQAAVANVPDYPSQFSKEEVLNTLLDALPESKNPTADCDSCETMYDVLVKIIHSIIKWEETAHNSSPDKEWAIGVAVDLHGLQEGGTFVNSLLKKIDRTLTNHLAKVIQFIDQHGNLQLYRDENMREFWLNALANDGICNIISLSQQDIASKYAVCPKKGSTTTTIVYKCQVPFSWIIIPLLEAQWKSLPDISDKDLSTFYCTVRSSKIASCLTYIEPNQAVAVGLPQKYLDDYTDYILQPKCAHERKVLQAYLQCWSERILKTVEEVTCLHTILSYHVAYHANAKQIMHYRELGRISTALQQKISENLSPQDHPLDLLAVETLFSELEPHPATDKQFWELRNLRGVYIKKLRECQEPVNAILKSSRILTDQLVKLRGNWQKMKAIEMYIEHLVLPLPENHEVCKGAYDLVYTWGFRLWEMLKRRVKSFSKMDAIQTVMKAIKGVAVRLSTYFKEQRESDLHEGHDMDTASSSDMDLSYDHFNTRLKMLFLEVVSILCFGSGSYSPPESELIKFLLGIVFNVDEKRTQDLTPWEQKDENPVIRSVLLQLMLSRDLSECGDTGALVNKFIKASQAFAVDEDSLEIFALVVRCLEDKIYKEQRMMLDLDSAEDTITSSITIYCQQEPYTFEWLNSIALLRFYLSLVANLLKSYTEASDNDGTCRVMRIMEHWHENDEEKFSDISLYLTKILVRRYGMKTLQCLLDKGYLFVLPTSLHCKQKYALPDHYMVLGAPYMEICDALTQSVLEASSSPLQLSMENLSSDDAHCIPLALFSNISWPVSQTLGIPKELLENFADHCKECGLLNQELTDLCLMMLSKEISGRSSVMLPSIDSDDRMLVSLVLLTVTILLHKRKEPLCRPFIDILDANKDLKVMYLPTMPDNFLLEAMEILSREEGPYKDKHDISGQHYACPNGHPYIITECTGPNEGRPCPWCNAPIGAQNSQIAEGNIKLDRLTATAILVETGYILGNVESQCHSAVPERDLTPLACAVIRFMIHTSFLWASCHCNQECLHHIHEAINIEVKDSPVFFWHHLKYDFNLIGNTLGISKEEAALMISKVLLAIVNKPLPQTHAAPTSLITKDSRCKWETMFSTDVLGPILGNSSTVIQEALNELAKDSKSAHDKVFLAVYERTTSEPSMTQTLWTYRSPISIQNLTENLINLPNARMEYALLYKFLMEEPILRAVQYLPSIIALQHLLLNKYSYRIDRKSALHNMLIGTVPDEMRDSANSDEFQVNLESLRKAWKLVRGKLPHHRMKVPEEYISKMGDIADNLPLAYILPSTSGPGLCTLALMDFLLFQQNELLEFCRNSCKFSSLYEKPVPMSELLPFHVIAYEEEVDSVLLAHCRYSLEFGKGQEIYYDFAAFEKHLYDRFLVGKPVIDNAHPLMMTYTDDIARRDTFEQVRNKIKPQTSLTSDEQQDVLRGLNESLREISECLTVLTIAISFLANAGGSPDTLLREYIIDVLKIRKTEFCRNYTHAHILSLWETLAMEKARLHSLSGKKIPFDGFDVKTEAVFEDMPPDLRASFTEYLRIFNLDELMPFLFRFIQIELKAIPLENYWWTLSESLPSYEDCGLDEKLAQMHQGVLLKNSMDVWHCVVQYHKDLHNNTTD